MDSSTDEITPVQTQAQPETTQRMVRLNISDLRVGVVLRAPMHDDSDGRPKLLLGAGSVLSSAQLQLLGRRGISQVLVSESEVSWVLKVARNKPQKESAAKSATVGALNASFPTIPGSRVNANSMVHRLKPPANLKISRDDVVRVRDATNQSTKNADAIHQQFLASMQVNLSRLESLTESNCTELIQDFDAMTSEGNRPVVESTVSRFSLQTAILASSIGVVLGLSQQELNELQIGCLFHDIGLVHLPPAARFNERMWSSQEYRSHPLVAGEMLQQRSAIPNGARMVIYQMHERLDGSGFPRQRSGSQIHLLARIAAVADEFLTQMSMQRPTPVEPHAVLTGILQETKRGRFDPIVVRALLHAMSLFPIGSTIVLQDGRRARVVRANRQLYARPVIEILDSEQSPVIDLGLDLGVNIAQSGEYIGLAG